MKKEIIIIILMFILFFLRSPSRQHFNYEKNYLYSPSNGLIVDIKELDKDTIRIVYYLNLLDNHTQYIPIDSNVISIKRFYGKNFKAYSIHSDANSNVETTLYNKQFNFFYKITQRTGIIARRILNYTNLNDSLKTGDKLGFIILGSRVDIDIPKDKIQEILINRGEKIKTITKIIKLKNQQ